MSIRTLSPRLGRSVAERWYPSVVAVQAVTKVQTASGEETRSYAPLAGHEAIRAYIKPLPSPEQVGPDMTVTSGRYEAKLDGYYPQITEQMRLVEPGVRVYDVLDVLAHGTRVQSRLLVETMDPEGEA